MGFYRYQYDDDLLRKRIQDYSKTDLVKLCCDYAQFGNVKELEQVIKIRKDDIYWSFAIFDYAVQYTRLNVLKLLVQYQLLERRAVVGKMRSMIQTLWNGRKYTDPIHVNRRATWKKMLGVLLPTVDATKMIRYLELTVPEIENVGKYIQQFYPDEDQQMIAKINQIDQEFGII